MNKEISEGRALKRTRTYIGGQQSLDVVVLSSQGGGHGCYFISILFFLLISLFGTYIFGSFPFLRAPPPLRPFPA